MKDDRTYLIHTVFAVPAPDQWAAVMRLRDDLDKSKVRYAIEAMVEDSEIERPRRETLH